jgi:hypothetical protein
MEEPNPNLDLPVAVHFVVIVPPAPRTIEDVLIECGFTSQQADIAVEQGLEVCMSIATMTPEQIDKLYELKNSPPSVRIVQEVRLSARHNLLVFIQWLLEAYHIRVDLENVDLNDLTIEEMARTHIMASKIENKRIAPGKQSYWKSPSVYTGAGRD